MDNDKAKTLNRELEILRNELEHVFPEHEHHYHRIKQRIKEKEEELNSLLLPASPVRVHWWERFLKKEK